MPLTRRPRKRPFVACVKTALSPLGNCSKRRVQYLCQSTYQALDERRRSLTME